MYHSNGEKEKGDREGLRETETVLSECEILKKGLFI